MRVLQVVQCPQRRGAEVFAHELSHALRSLGHEVSTRYLEPAAEDSAALPFEPGDAVLAPGKAGTVRTSLALQREIRRLRPDVVQVNGSATVKVGALAGWSAPARGWVLVRRAIGDPAAWLRDRPRRWFYRFGVMPQVDGVVAVSQATLDGLRREGLAAPGVVIPRSVDARRFVASAPRDELRARHGVAPECPLVISVGSLTPEKRLDRLLRAVAAMAPRVKDLQAWIVGDGADRAELEGLARSLGVASRVRFWGAQRNVADLVGAADVLALTSDTEGIPGVVIEAACLGVPSVATRVGGVPECVLHERTGLLVDPEDGAALVHALEALATRSELRRSLGEAARAHALANFDLARAAERFVEFYRRVIDERERRARSA